LEPNSRRVLIVGVSTRAAAESAANAGFDVIALDAYADIDQHPSVRALSLSRDFHMPFSVDAIVNAAGDLASDAIVYLSSLENHPRAVAALAVGRELWGNTPEVLRRVRDPKTLADQFTQLGIRAPRVITSGQPGTVNVGNVEQWVLKPRVSGGGHGVGLWHSDQPVPRGQYLQEYVEGVPGSVVFVAAGGGGVALGVSRQLVGESAFGAVGFRYCGNILRSLDETVASNAIALVDAVTSAFPLVGVGGIDFVATASGLRPVEVNPRWSASMELVERARGISMFGAHADACVQRVLPQFDLKQPAATATHGKAIVFARQDVVVGDTTGWLHEPDIRDVPREGEHIAAGQPICTVFAAGTDDSTCHALLVERAARIYAEVVTP
jgi:predicted ATP-grasp superfamily ATP-dependent carboligase